MGTIKGKLEAAFTLNKNTCYFMRTGKCSLNLVDNYYVSSNVKTAPGDLLYCPRLYRAMCQREKNRAILINPCECGHVEVLSGAQRACIASQKRLLLTVHTADESAENPKELCQVCDGQLSFEEKNTGGARIVTIRARIEV